jgi:hypothetical protein
MGSFHLNLNMNIPPGALPVATSPVTALSAPQAAPQTLRLPARRAEKQAKHRCVVHPQRHKGCLARARFAAGVRHRRHHVAG